MNISRKNILNLSTVLSILASSVAKAGGSMGGGGPPAREKLIEELMQAQPGTGGIFDAGNGNLGLGFKGELNPEVIVTRSNTSSEVTLTDIDFARLVAVKGNIDVESISGTSTTDAINNLPITLRSSYRIEDGNTMGTLLLKDRRILMRGSVDNASEAAAK